MGSFSIFHLLVVVIIVALIFFRGGGSGMRFKIRNAFIAGAVYLWLIVVTAQAAPALLLVAAVYVAACMWLTKVMIDGAETRRSGKAIEFAGTDPAASLGALYGSFHHVFYSRDAVIERFRGDLAAALENKLGATTLSEI